MARRFWSNPGRIIVSKLGYDASPSLADTSKIFDSDWNFSGLIIARGTFTDPTTSLPNPNSAPITVPFDSPGYIPSVVATTTIGDFDPSNPFDAVLSTIPAPCRVYADHFDVLRVNNGSNFYNTYPGINRYVVFALGALQ